MYLTHKICLIPTSAQERHFVRAAGISRFAYNWGLSEWIRERKEGGRPNILAIRRRMNAIKKDEFPWMGEVSKCVVQNSLINLGRAFDMFFKGVSKHPKFHKKYSKDSFKFDNFVSKVDGSRIRIPKLGWVRMREALRFTGKLISCTISRRADKWFASIVVDTEPVLKPAENQGAVGIDLGLTTFATLSNGQKIAAPKPLERNLSKLRRLDRSLSRKKNESKNRKKARIKLARFHFKIANMRHDFLHKLSSDVIKSYATVVVEGMNVSGLMRNRRVSRAIGDSGWSTFRKMLGYKAKFRGVDFVEADRFYPSSKLCSECGHKAEQMPLSVRQWKCPCCGAEHDRDVNAAINLVKLAAGHAVTACGEGSSGALLTTRETNLCETRRGFPMPDYALCVGA